MSIAYLAHGDAITAAQANALFDAGDNLFRCLFNSQSPLLYLPHSGSSSWLESGLAGMLVVFGTKASRRIFSTTDSHDQATIDSAVAAATLGSQDDDLKQVIATSLSAGALSKSLVPHTRDVTPGGGGPAEPYWVTVEYLTGYYHHEKYHELACLDVVFEGHASRTFTWDDTWTKVRCIRFHNLDSDATPLVITMPTGDVVELGPWECQTWRYDPALDEWAEQGFVFWRATTADVERFGGTLCWNNSRDEGWGTSLRDVWNSDAGNNVASLASFVYALDYFTGSDTPPLWADASEVGDGVADTFERETGFHWNGSTLTRNAGTIDPYPDPTSSTTKTFQLFLHGGHFIIARKETSGDTTIATATATMTDLLGGASDSGLELGIDVGGDGAHLKLINETGLDYADVIPLSSNIVTTGFPFTIPADGVGYAISFGARNYPDLYRMKAGTTVTENVDGIGTSVSRDYTPLELENAYDDLDYWPRMTSTIGDVAAWSFPSGAVANSYQSTVTNAVRWDGRALCIDFAQTFLPSGGAFPSASTAQAWLRGRPVSSSAVSVTQSAVLAELPSRGGIWFTPNRSRGSITEEANQQVHPWIADQFGEVNGGDWVARSCLSVPGTNIARQIGLESGSGSANVVHPVFGPSYFTAKDSTDFIVANITPAWWVTNRASALAGSVLSGETRQAITVPIYAVHYNAIAARLNAIESVYPFSFFDAVYYGRDLRFLSDSAGIFGGHFYPTGFACYAPTGSAALAVATDLGITVSSFATTHAALSGHADSDVTGVDASGSVGLAFDKTGMGGINLWNTDMPIQLAPARFADLNRLESAIFTLGASPGAGWIEGETAGLVKWWWLPNDSEFDFPDFDFLTVANIKSVADSLGIPFRFLRMSSLWDVVYATPDRATIGARIVIGTSGLGGSFSRSELRVRQGSAGPTLQAFVNHNPAGGSITWSKRDLVRLSDWPPYPDTQAYDDATMKSANADPRHGYNRGGGGYVNTPFGFNPASGTPTPSWQNDSPFDGEATKLWLEVYDTIPTPPSGFAKGTHRVGCYPVPIVQWGASDVEAHAAPSVSAGFLSTSSLGTSFTASSVWSGLGGSGSWSGEGAFACQLLPAGIVPA